MQLSALARQKGQSLVHLKTVGSTSSEVLARLAADPKLAPMWLLSDQQTAGRGRSGAWVSDRGNLALSFGFVPDAPSSKLPQLGLLAGLALADAVSDGLPERERTKVKLKWPNDLLLDGEKVAGILVDARSHGTERVAVIGWGVNCSSHPHGVPYRVGDLSRFGADLSRDALMTRLTESLNLWLERWDQGNDFMKLRASWLLRAHAMGDYAEVRVNEQKRRGKLITMDEVGALVVDFEDGKGQIKLHAGEITH